MEGSSLSVRKGAWTEEEDTLLKKCIEKYGQGTWHQVPSRAGLNRCRKSCRLRWLNYLKPNIKKGAFAADEVDLIIRLHNLLGNRWSLIAGRLPGRTGNDVKNYWNNHLLMKRINPSDSNSNPKPHLNPWEPNTKVIKPQPHNLSKNIFPLSSDGNKGNNNNTATVAATPTSNNFVLTDNSNNENEEIMWWENMLMNEDEFDDQQPGSANDINLCVLGNQSINEELGVVEEGHYGNLDELFLDAEVWNVFNL
ncbi:hypothetical protein HRI_002225000 [Hibiscus trionum]|uniref:Uncharacterized protein n=1 Tax=Hibiscus trionum TaxID=183268 RepID=A0A9W7HZ11_HIBTR|nr:hypothetical protein HRI_002225000 [Hibiscus trionum]